eukprot:gene7922-7991_t
MKKVLLITDVNFWERSSGNRTRIMSLINYLQNQVDLTVVNTGPAPINIEQTLSNTYNAYFKVLEYKKYLSSTGYGKRMKAFMKDRQYDVVIIEYIHSSYFLNFLDDDTKVILDAHDIISERTEEFKKFNHTGALYELPPETEFSIMNVYDKIMVLCEPDREKLADSLGSEKILLCPHPVSIKNYALRPKVKNIIFIASAYLPNKDAINYFISECWPAIAKTHPVELLIYGTVNEAVIPDDEKRIRVMGFVADIEQAYAAADIVINPVRFGAGLKIKNVEALAHGIPLVTTSHGARGLNAAHNAALVVADDSPSFIKAVLSLIEDVDLRSKLLNNARAFIKENFNAEKCFKPLITEINAD